MVIFARAWFSDSEMNFSLMPGFAFSNSDDSFCASVICELDTRAIVTSLSDAPRLPAPEQPAVSSQPGRPARTPRACRSALSLSSSPHSSTKSLNPKANGHNRCRIPGASPTCRAARPAWPRAWPAPLQIRMVLAHAADVLERDRDRAVRQLGDDGRAVGVEEPAADLADRPERRSVRRASGCRGSCPRTTWSTWTPHRRRTASCRRAGRPPACARSPSRCASRPPSTGRRTAARAAAWRRRATCPRCD